MSGSPTGHGISLFRLFNRWSADISHEWSLSGVSNADELSSPFHLALLYLLELHSELQGLLIRSESSASGEYVVRRLAILEQGVVVGVIPEVLAKFGNTLARSHAGAVNCCEEWYVSYSHAVASYRERVSQLFGASLFWRPDADGIDYADFVRNRREEFVRFRDDGAGRSWRPCFDFVVEDNNVCFTGRDLAAYEKWLSTHPEWNLSDETTSHAPRSEMAPLSGKALQALLDISDVTLLRYRKAAGLLVGARGKTVVWMPQDVVALCDTIVRCCPTPDTRERASQLKAKCLPDCQIS